MMRSNSDDLVIRCDLLFFATQCPSREPTLCNENYVTRYRILSRPDCKVPFTYTAVLRFIGKSKDQKIRLIQKLTITYHPPKVGCVIFTSQAKLGGMVIASLISKNKAMMSQQSLKKPETHMFCTKKHYFLLKHV